MDSRRTQVIHPSYIALTLVLFGITSLFLGLSASYIYQRVQTGAPPIELPSLFYYNTLLLLGSSYTLIMAHKMYLQDNTRAYQGYLIATLLLTLGFLACQILAWNQLRSQEIFVNYSNMASYIYLISAVHLLHVVAGIPFIGIFIYTSIKKMKTPVSVLVYFSDPARRRKLKLLSWYWHFLDGLWIYLILFFIINYMIK